MTQNWLVTKLQNLEKIKNDLLKELTAAYQQWGGTLDDADREILTKRIESIEAKLETKEGEISITNAKLERARIKPMDSDNLVASQLSVQVAVVSMTRKQVLTLNSTLDTEGITADISEFPSLQQMYSILSNYGIDEIESCYGEEPDDWKPLLSNNNLTIKQIIMDVLEKTTSSHPGWAGNATVHLQSVSSAFLSEEDTDRDDARILLATRGGVIVVDALSLYHPTIRKYLADSNLFAINLPVAMVVLSPLRSDRIPVHQILHGQIFPTHFEVAFQHFVKRLDPFYEFNVGDYCGLRRWLFSVLPNYKRRAMSSEARAAAETQLGPSVGMVQYVSGTPWI